MKQKKSTMANFDSLIDDTSSFDAQNDDLNFIELNMTGIDNVTIPNEISTWDQSKSGPEFRDFSYVDNHEALIREVILLRKQESEFHDTMLKLEREKISLMEKNNELLKSMLEKIDSKRLWIIGA